MIRYQHIIIIIFIISMAGCAAKHAALKPNPPGSYAINGKTYCPMKQVSKGFSQNGTASWYGPGFNGRKTSSGEVYDMYGLTAAHTVLPLNTVVKVTNLANRKDVIVRINDRGPFVGERVIDLSLSAARALGMVTPGTAPVKLTVLGSSDVKLASAKHVPSIKKQEIRAPNPFYRRGSTTMLALSRN